MSEIGENLARVRTAIHQAAKRSGRDGAEIKLVAVSKTKPVEAIKDAIAAGQLDFGENYAQELRDKMEEVEAPDVRWHFIGHLQRNKVKYLMGKVEAIHSVDGLELAREISKRSQNLGISTRVLLEVNLGGEDSKSGCGEDEALGLIEVVGRLPGLDLIGLMTMPPYLEDPEAERPFYRRLRELRDRARERLGDPEMLPELSMGLSHDFEVAVEEGSTMVRVGTAIFGERRYA